MHNEWPTKEQDLQVAVAIFNKHRELNDNAPLGFLEIVVHKNQKKDVKKKVEVKVPQWINELLTYFREQYGYEHGHAITSKVLTKFLLQNETLH